MQPNLSLLHWILLAGALGAASILDIFARRIPNWLTMGLLASGLAARSVSTGWVSGIWGLGGAVVGLLLLLWPFSHGLIAGGDAKLMAACGAWLGPVLVVPAFFAATIVGGGIALVYWIRAPRDVRGDVAQNFKLSVLTMGLVTSDKRPAAHSPPYAPAIAAGTIIALLIHAEQLVRV